MPKTLKVTSLVKVVSLGRFINSNPSRLENKGVLKTAKEVCIDFRLYKYPASIKNDELRKEILKIANHKTCGGVIIQLPLPKHINKHVCLNVIPREKDIDVLGERALGAFYTNRNPVLPPAVGVVERIIQNSLAGQAKFPGRAGEIRDLKVIVIGRGLLVGKPISVWLINKVAELTVFSSSTKNLRRKLKSADIIISGVGKANLFNSEDLKEDALIIDFGYSTDEAGKLHGDFSLADQQTSKLVNYTPTPGGTGPILVTQLLENFYTLVEMQSK